MVVIDIPMTLIKKPKFLTALILANSFNYCMKPGNYLDIQNL